MGFSCSLLESARLIICYMYIYIYVIKSYNNFISSVLLLIMKSGLEPKSCFIVVDSAATDNYDSVAR